LLVAVLATSPALACQFTDVSYLMFTAPTPALEAELRRAGMPKDHDVLLVGTAHEWKNPYLKDFATRAQTAGNRPNSIAMLTLAKSGNGVGTVQVLDRRGDRWVSLTSARFDISADTLAVGTDIYSGAKQPFRMFAIKSGRDFATFQRIELDRIGYRGVWTTPTAIGKAHHDLHVWSGGGYRTLNTAEGAAFTSAEIKNSMCFTPP
jgi:hypothetical protein